MRINACDLRRRFLFPPRRYSTWSVSAIEMMSFEPQSINARWGGGGTQLCFSLGWQRETYLHPTSNEHSPRFRYVQISAFAEGMGGKLSGLSVSVKFICQSSEPLLSQRWSVTVPSYRSHFSLISRRSFSPPLILWLPTLAVNLVRVEMPPSGGQAGRAELSQGAGRWCT